MMTRRGLPLLATAVASLTTAAPAAAWQMHADPFGQATTSTRTTPGAERTAASTGAGPLAPDPPPPAAAEPTAAPSLTAPPVAVLVVVTPPPPAPIAVGGRGGDGGAAGLVNVAVGEGATAGNGGAGGDGGDATVIVGETAVSAAGQPGQAGVSSAAAQAACRLALAIGANASAGNGAGGCVYALAIGTGASAGDVPATITTVAGGDPAAPWAGVQALDDRCGAILSTAFCAELDALSAASAASG
jgi:hypothetical protein